MTTITAQEIIDLNDPENLVNVVLELGRRVEALERSPLEVDRLDELTPTAGDLTATSTVYPGMIENEDGIAFPQVGDGVLLGGTARVASETNSAGVNGGVIESFDVDNAIRIETNGDFETGDLTGWTVNAGGDVSVVTDDVHGGAYACQINGPYLGGPYPPGYHSQLSQVITLSAATRSVFVRLRCRSEQGLNVSLIYLDAANAEVSSKAYRFKNRTTVEDDGSWRLYTCGINPSGAGIAKIKVLITAFSLTTGSVVIDDVEIYEGNSSAVRYSRITMDGSGIVNVYGALAADNLSGMNTGDQTLLGLGAIGSVYTPTPTLPAGSNVSAATSTVACIHIKMDGVVLVAGYFTADAIAVGACEVQITLPVSSNFTTGFQALGIVTMANGDVGRVLSDATTKKARLVWNSTITANQAGNFVFGYRIF
jgi:hypothetical protein